MKKSRGKEFIPRFDLYELIFPDYIRREIPAYQAANAANLYIWRSFHYPPPEDALSCSFSSADLRLISVSIIINIINNYNLSVYLCDPWHEE